MRFLVLALLVASCGGSDPARESARDRELAALAGRVDALERSQRAAESRAAAASLDAGAVKPKAWCLHPDSNGACFHFEPLVPMSDSAYCMKVVHSSKCRVAQRRSVLPSGVRIVEIVEAVPE